MEASKMGAAAPGPSGDVPAPFAPRVWPILTLGDRLGRRTAVVLWLALAVGLGLFLGWRWLVAAGLSTVVLAILPCAAMCALGVCSGSSEKKCSDKNAPSAPPDTNA